MAYAKKIGTQSSLLCDHSYDRNIVLSDCPRPSEFDFSGILVGLNTTPKIGTIKQIITMSLDNPDPNIVYEKSWMVYYKLNNIQTFDIDEIDDFLTDVKSKTEMKYGGTFWISPSGKIFECDEHITLDLAFYNQFIKTEDSFYNKKTVPYFLEQQGFVRWQKDSISFMTEPNNKQFNSIGQLITKYRKENQGGSLYFEADNIVFFKKRYENPHLDEIISDIKMAYV